MKKVIFITHANVQIDPAVPVPDWGLSVVGRERHKIFNSNKVISQVTAIYCSEEQKAIDGASILSEFLGIDFSKVHELHENDRSATGYLEPDEFQSVADRFFENPVESIRGWERAIDAQTRIVDCINRILDKDNSSGDIAVVAHGGVGALLLCQLAGSEITRKLDQPDNGGGNYFVFDSATLNLTQHWKPIDQSV
ncbi:MAG: histidine phosphatase family protein [Granulosicoccus sp.]